MFGGSASVQKRVHTRAVAIERAACLDASLKLLGLATPWLGMGSASTAGLPAARAACQARGGIEAIQESSLRGCAAGPPVFCDDAQAREAVFRPPGHICLGFPPDALGAQVVFCMAVASPDVGGGFGLGLELAALQLVQVELAAFQLVQSMIVS